ncbi:hypothetical protein ABZ848_41910 [Streptomyces sp. NPDC047081]|uniref:hypothetical protein n=1 Tax=Streptomyces sp. NPDC047081 TaxID=3154706 RepID=UPI0033C96C58
MRAEPEAGRVCGVPLPSTVYPLGKGRVWAMLAGSLLFVQRAWCSWPPTAP